MVHFFIGTKAQFIKMVPIMLEMQKRGLPYRYIDSGQHGEITRSLRIIFGIREPDISFNAGHDIINLPEAVGWVLRLYSHTVFSKKWLRHEVFAGGGICLIHGDTVSTFLGLKMAKAAGLQVGHVEAGLRSYDIFHPFPEELTRIYCMKRCEVLFTPSSEAEQNLLRMKVHGTVVRVDGNTVVDALRSVEDADVTLDVPAEPFALAACHRIETITNRQRLSLVVKLLNRVARDMKVVFVMHKPTRKYLERFGLTKKISSGVQTLSMQDYMSFITLMKNAKIVLADGGSIQEECSYLGKPCLILRSETERPDGLGRNAILWRFKEDISERFLSEVDKLNTSVEGWPSPSTKVVNFLACHYT